MKSHWYLLFSIFLISHSALVLAQTTKKAPTGVVKTTSDEYNRQLEKCKVDAQVTPVPTSNTANSNNSARSSKAKSE
jgi:Trk K+ transport system NAD-binding subunit